MTQQQSPVWVITGCSTGFGKELAKLVLGRGWRAVVTARKPDQLTEFVSRQKKENVLAMQLDVTNWEQITQAVQQAEKQFGRIDVLVNNAGYGYLAAVEEGEDDQVRAGEAIIAAVGSDHPPLHLLLGKLALEMGCQKLEAMKKDFDAWRKASLGADYPEFQDGE